MHHREGGSGCKGMHHEACTAMAAEEKGTAEPKSCDRRPVRKERVSLPKPSFNVCSCRKRLYLNLGLTFKTPKFPQVTKKKNEISVSKLQLGVCLFQEAEIVCRYDQRSQSWSYYKSILRQVITQVVCFLQTPTYQRMTGILMRLLQKPKAH